MRTAPRLMAFLLCIACAASAHAQPAGYDQQITEALQAFELGRWTEARSHFRRAHELDPTARTLRTIGMCSFNLGDYAAAVVNLETALSDTRKPLTAEQRAQVSDLVNSANTKLARFRLQLSPEDLSVLVDGTAPVMTASRELLLEPGRHQLQASAQGYLSQRRELNVEAGDRSLLELRLEPSPVSEVAVAAPAPLAVAPAQPALAAQPEPAAASSAAAPAPSRDGSSTLTTLGYVSLVVGVAGIASFAISGALALSKTSDLDQACPDRRCAPAQFDDVDAYDRDKSVSTISLIAGGAMLSLGAVLLLVDDGEPSSSEHAWLSPQLGFGWAGVRGGL